MIIAMFVVMLPTTSADVIMPGEKNIMIRYKIVNMVNYEDYVFFLYGTRVMNTYQIITSDESFSFYKFSVASIYAIKKIDFNESEIGQNESERRQFFDNNTKLVKSNIELVSLYGTIPEDDPLESVLIVLEISVLNEDSLEIHESEVIYRYTNGTSEEKDIAANQNNTSGIIPYLQVIYRHLLIQQWYRLGLNHVGISVYQFQQV